jgi:2-polyprenyl-6-methoxyphenol hydroxylase-like FAD-dependent oxidoreductase
VAPRSILIVGGGIAGMSAAILLARSGARVDLIDLDAQWKVTGAGITITGPTLRAMQTLGILDEVRALGYTGNGIRVCATDGSVIAELATPAPKGTDIEGSGGIMRPVLHRILSQHVLARGTNVTLGVTVESLQQEQNLIRVQLSNGVHASYDLVIGADGLHSRVRKLLLSDAPTPSTRASASGAWRCRGRLASIDDTFSWADRSRSGSVRFEGRDVHVPARKRAARLVG